MTPYEEMLQRFESMNPYGHVPVLYMVYRIDEAPEHEHYRVSVGVPPTYRDQSNQNIYMPNGDVIGKSGNAGNNGHQ